MSLRPKILLVLASATAGLWVFQLVSRPHPDHTVPKTGVTHLAEHVPATWDEILLALTGARETRPKTEYLTKLRTALLAMPRAESREWILGQLRGRKDVPTGLGFLISRDQSLAQWPSWRVFLLDVLQTVDPSAAAAAGREILMVPTTADEWAVAMRNVARGASSPQDTELLRTKCAELMRRDEWRREASAGYLEAFDVIVYTRNTSLAPELLALTMSQDQKAVRHAAFLTLDRLVLAAPAAVLSVLVQENSPPDSGPMISNMVARADVRDATQRALVESWLRNPHRTRDELAGFTGTFPNANQLVSYNLLTPVITVNPADQAQIDRGTLGVVDEWLADASLASVHELLRETRRRLLGFVRPP